VWHHHCESKVTIPQPTQLRKQGPALRALAIALACLGVCVFAWGLRYKLSLYDPPHSMSRHMPAAKLLTGNERRGLPTVDLRPASALPGLALFTALVFSVLLLKDHRLARFFGFSRLILAGRRPTPAWAPVAATFIRPPPRFR
jgi:hypothetical protein